MTNQKISTKKLKAIVFTDIVDFTKMSAEDEQHALDIIHKQRELLKPIVLEHKGEWLKEIGDGLLFSFDSSLDAVRCSIKIQEALRDIDDFKLRIGIHQGDIFIQDGDVYGDDVNIASRVEGFSPEGGISISDKVYKDIQGVKDIKTSFIGHKPLKGVNQETKVRCITSNDLPKSRGTLIPKIIGFSNIYFGIFSITLFLVFGIAIYHEGVDTTTTNLTQMEMTYALEFLLLNIGLILILFGYSTLSYHRGISIKSQKLIYYLGIIYFLLNCFLISNFGVDVKNDDGSMETDWGAYLLVILLPILFLLVPRVYKIFKNNPNSVS